MEGKEWLKWWEQIKQPNINDLIKNPEGIDQVSLWDLDKFMMLAEKEMAGNDQKLEQLQKIIENNPNLA